MSYKITLLKDAVNAILKGMVVMVKKNGVINGTLAVYRTGLKLSAMS